ncbi:MAG: FAD-dependent oxidoreductase [Dermatophilaceae bacterium]
MSDQLAGSNHAPTAFDAVVVGAGPGGAAAALALARAGRSVALIERGLFPGAKNMYGGVVYGRVLDDLVPNWWQDVPYQRWVSRRATMLMTPTQSLTIGYRSDNWIEPPYNGMTAYRADFDAWLAGKAVEAGATLVCSTTVTGLLRDPGGRICGVRTDRPDGDVLAGVVIACDGVNSFLAKSAGLYERFDPHNFTVGVKEVLRLPREVIDERCRLSGDEGLDIEIVGCTRGIPGGGFFYTNRGTVAVGIVVSVTALAAAKVRPETLLEELKTHPSVAPLVAGGELVEYSAHTIPEGGYDVMPELVADRMLVAGDAAAMCLASGIWLEGVNYAIGSGAAAGEAAHEALTAGDATVEALGGYRRRLENTFVLQDHRKLRKVPGLIMSERVQQKYPPFVCDLVERMFTVDNPAPKLGMRRWANAARRAHGVRVMDLIRDGANGLRSFG